MKEIKIITAEEAIKALPDFKEIHCFASFIGTDWNREDIIKELKMAKRIAWVDDIFNHDLAIEAGEKSTWFGRSVLRFDVRKPKI